MKNRVTTRKIARAENKLVGFTKVVDRLGVTDEESALLTDSIDLLQEAHQELTSVSAEKSLHDEYAMAIIQGMDLVAALCSDENCDNLIRQAFRLADLAMEERSR